jgi:hypothetical protein
MGTFTSLILRGLATRFGFPVAFGGAPIFMLVFLISVLFIVDQSSYRRLVAHANLSRSAT